MKRLAILILWLALPLVLSGNTDCAHTEYTIDMTLTKDGATRSLTCKRVGGEDEDVPEDTLAHLSQVYGAQKTGPGATACRYSKSFFGRLPEDVGGAGTIQSFQSSLGKTSGYMERFRGNDDPGQQVERSLAAADGVSDMLIGWAAWQLQEDPGFGQLRAFLDSKLRADLKNMLIYTSSMLLLQDYTENAEEDLTLRMVQYLLEHDYFQPSDLPTIVAGFQRDEAATDPARTNTMDLVRRKLAREMDLAPTAPLPAALDFLKTPKTAHDSLLAYLRTTPDFRRRAAGKPDFEPGELLDEKIEQMFDLALFSPEDRVAVTLHCPVAPHRTNGTWTAAAATVTWADSAIRYKPRLPLLLYAFWSEPAKAEQERIFGQVALQGDRLAEVILWQNGLSEAEAKAFDALLQELAAAAKPADKISLLTGFRFDAKAETDDLAQFATSRILAGLGVAGPASAPAEQKKP